MLQKPYRRAPPRSLARSTRRMAGPLAYKPRRLPLDRVPCRDSVGHPAKGATGVRPDGGLRVPRRSCWPVCGFEFWSWCANHRARWMSWRSNAKFRRLRCNGCWSLRAPCAYSNYVARGATASGRSGHPWRCDPGLRAMIEHHAVLYQDMLDPVACCSTSYLEANGRAFGLTLSLVLLKGLRDAGRPTK